VLGEGEALGVVGISGSGKSVLARSVMGLVRDPGRIVAGTVKLRGENIVGASQTRLTALWGKEMALILSSPKSRLNPLVAVGKQLANVIMAKQALGKKAARERAVDLLASVAIGDPSRVAGLLPHELSGGMAQRVVIAMALSNSPRLLVADEPTAGLDVTVQTQVLELMMRLVQDTRAALLLMTRDLGIVAHYVERVAVLSSGHIIEDRRVREFFNSPQHPESSRLLEMAFAAHGERTSR
jgi:ABC-type dipeptide/oligopeptide/nickel transport system ATPase component